MPPQYRLPRSAKRTQFGQRHPAVIFSIWACAAIVTGLLADLGLALVLDFCEASRARRVARERFISEFMIMKDFMKKYI